MKILYVTTVGQTMGFFTSMIAELIQEGHSVDIACSNIERVPQKYNEMGCKAFPLSCSRNPFNLGNIKAVKEIKELIVSGKYDVVHCHTPIVATLARFACKSFRKKGLKVFYTAHGFHFYKGAPLINWFLYYPIEQLCSRWTDVLITMNKEDFELAKRKMKAKSVKYIPGVGIDTRKFSRTTTDRTEKRKRLGLQNNDIMLLSVGELNPGKNHGVIIKSLAELKNPRLHFFIAGQGSQKIHLEQMATNLRIANQVSLIGYRKDIPELLRAADIFCFPSKREGLPVSLMEAMASGLPCVASKIRGNIDLISDGEGGILCHYNDIKGFAVAIDQLYKNTELREKMGNINKKNIKQMDMKTINRNNKKLYKDTTKIN